MCGYDSVGSTVERYEIDGYEVHVTYYADCESFADPCGDDGDGTVSIVCWEHVTQGFWPLGDWRVNAKDYATMVQATRQFGPVIAILPVYGLPLEGGESYISVRPIGSPDSCAQIGWAFIEGRHAKDLELRGLNTQQLYERIDAKVQAYDSYLRGDVYGFAICKGDRLVNYGGPFLSTREARDFVDFEWVELVVNPECEEDEEDAA